LPFSLWLEKGAPFRLIPRWTRLQHDELMRWQEVMLGREERVQQLKAEVNELRVRFGEPMHYDSEVDS